LNPDIAHIEKDFTITGVRFIAGSEPVSVSITPTVDGEISATVSNAAGDITDTLTGRINLLTGILDISCVGGKLNGVSFTATVSLEENTINPRVTFNIDKLRLVARGQFRWSRTSRPSSMLTFSLSSSL
jgi:hypothetical protein